MRLRRGSEPGGWGAQRQGGHCLPGRPPAGLSWFVLGGCQAVTTQPDDRAGWPYMVREREEGSLLAQERKGEVIARPAQH